MEISEYPNYLVYKNGKVWSTFKKKYLSPASDRKGYEYIVCYDGKGNSKTKKIHRLVAETYIPNPNGYPQVHHKNNNVKDNNVENLEWVTNLYNCQSIRRNCNFGKIIYDRRNQTYRYSLTEMGKLRTISFKTQEEAEIYREVTKLFYEELVMN